MESNSNGQFMNYKVVISPEQLYSIWPVERENPLGWQNVGVTGSMEKCWGYIRAVWMDMRLLNLGKNMQEASGEANKR